MAVREIKTTLAVDGEKAFNKAITESGRNMRVMASEMKAAAADFNLTGDEMEFLGRKSRNLNDQIRQQEAIIQALEGAVRDSAEAYGDASAKTDGYRIKLNNARASLSRLEEELRTTDGRLEEIGQESERAGRQLESGIGDSAEETAKDVRNLYDALKEDIGSIGSSSAVSAFTDIGGAVTDAFSALNDFAESGRDYRRQMAFLEQNARNAGLEFADVKDQLMVVTGLTGDLDGAVEGVSNLLASGFDTHEMEDAINSLAGAVIRFPETIKFENLAESLQESLKGEGTGQFAELIERISGPEGLEKFNAQMAAATSEADKQRIALETLNSMGLSATYEEYKQLNGELINAETASLRLEGAWANLGSTIDTALIPMKEGLADAITAIDEFIKHDKLNTWFTDLGAKMAGTQSQDNMFTKMFSNAEEEGRGAGENVIDGVNEGMDANADEAEKNAAVIGENIGANIADGIDRQVPYIASQAAAAYQAIEAELNRTVQGPRIVMPASGYAAAAGAISTGTGEAGRYAAGSASVTMELDGKTVGEGMVEYNSDAMGSQLERASTYLY